MKEKVQLAMKKKSLVRDDEMLSRLHGVFRRLTTTDSRHWTPCLFRVDKEPISFDVREISVEQDGWKAYLESIEKDYVGDKKPILGEGFSFREYDGSAPEEGVAFHARMSDEPVGTAAGLFLKLAFGADVERGGEDFHDNGFAIRGRTESRDNIVFVSVRPPSVQLKNRFWLLYDRTEYKPVDRRLLALPKRIDAVFSGTEVWFLTLQGTQMFAPESICRTIARKRIAGMKELRWIEGFGVLEREATKGYNPRRFLAFNEGKVAELDVPSKRKAIARKFKIGLTKAGNVNLSDPVSANKFIKIVCDKAMVDPFDDAPMEVSGAKKWSAG